MGSAGRRSGRPALGEDRTDLCRGMADRNGRVAADFPGDGGLRKAGSVCGPLAGTVWTTSCVRALSILLNNVEDVVTGPAEAASIDATH